MNYDADKIVKVPVTVKNRAIIFPVDFDLDALCRNEFHAELVLSQFNFVKKEVFDSLIKETAADFLPARSRLFVNIGLKETLADEKLRKFIITDEKPRPSVQGGFIEVYLEKDLKINLRGSKKAQLLDCPVHIPALSKTAKSLNHACTLVSEKFELWRRAHTANVFQKVFYLNEDTGLWRVLDERRNQVESGNKKITSNSTE